MPLIDMLGEASELYALGGGDERIIADLRQLVGMEAHLGAEMIGEHLRAETDAEERLLLLQCDPDPLRLEANELVLFVGAHGTAENDGAAVGLQRLVPGIPVA